MTYAEQWTLSMALGGRAPETGNVLSEATSAGLRFKGWTTWQPWAIAGGAAATGAAIGAMVNGKTGAFVGAGVGVGAIFVAAIAGKGLAG